LLAASVYWLPWAALGDDGRPNIVFMLCDDLRYAALAANGNEIVETPHLDALAKRGVTFDNAFVTTAICQTSRANILTGQYASRNGFVHSRQLGRRKFSADDLAGTYPALLKAAGYYTGYVGKWHVGVPPQDFFDFDASYPGQGRYWIEVDGRPKHMTEHIGDQAVEMIRTAPEDKPFCMAVGFKAPHVQDGFTNEPYQPLPAVATLYETTRIPAPPLSDSAFFDAQPEFLRNSMGRARWQYRLGPPESLNFQRSVRRYYRMVSGVDMQVGRIVEALRDAGNLDNTVIVFTSEHGVYLGARGLAGKWLGHEPSIHIPLIVADPRADAAQHGTRREQMALTIDLAPTLLDLAGARIPASMQGRSLAPLLAGEKPADWRTEYFYEYTSRISTIPRSEGVRTERYKYLRYLDQEPPYEELYDLQDDPHEAHNLASDAQHAELLATMRGKWKSWRRRVK
jgi:arylsulfatase A-like enzyme